MTDRHVSDEVSKPVTGGQTAVLAEAWNSATDDDRDLVLAAQEDSHAFAAIYTRHARSVYVYVRSRCSCDDDAMDLTQQVFVKAYKALPRYRVSGAPLSAWLYRIARNAIVDHQRRTRPTTDLDAAPAVLHDRSPGPEELAEQAEDSSRLRNALSALDRDKRDILSLRYAGGLKIAEIAAVTGRTEEATKKRLARALMALRKQYDQVI